MLKPKTRKFKAFEAHAKWSLFQGRLHSDFFARGEPKDFVDCLKFHAAVRISLAERNVRRRTAARPWLRSGKKGPPVHCIGDRGRTSGPITGKLFLDQVWPSSNFLGFGYNQVDFFFNPLGLEAW